MPSLFSRLIEPHYPSSAVGLEKGIASVVHLERTRGKACQVRNAATFNISQSLIQPGFDDPNLENPAELADVLRQLTTSVGLIRQKRWSVALPETSARTVVLVMESETSGSEAQEVLKWKIERAFDAQLTDLSVVREKLARDAQGRDRYLVIAMRRTVLREYESLFESLGWRAGLILPRHIGESQWLTRNGSTGDALLLSGSQEGFTAVIFRGKHPLILRTINCPPEEREDELFRLLLYYRDRRADELETGPRLTRLLVVGEEFPKERVGTLVNETVGSDLRLLQAEDLGLLLPTRDLSFDAIAAPAGLATLAW